MDSQISVLSMDIGGTNMRTGMVLPDLTVAGFEIVRSAGILELDDPSGALLQHIEQYQHRAYPGAGPLAVALGFPATIDRSRRVVLSTSNIRSMQNLPIADFLEQRLGIPVLIDRDVNMLLRHDMHTHGIGPAGIVIGCYVGTGLGSAISINGSIYVGKHGVAGELGHLPTLGLSGRCGCGNNGCIETVASGKYLVELALREFPATPIGEIFLRHANHPEIEQFIRFLAIPIASEINILDPETVVLGGGVVQADCFPTAALERQIRELTRKPYPSQAINFVYSSGGQEGGVIGAGMYAYEALQKSEGHLTLATRSSS